MRQTEGVIYTDEARSPQVPVRRPTVGRPRAGRLSTAPLFSKILRLQQAFVAKGSSHQLSWSAEAKGTQAPQRSHACDADSADPPLTSTEWAPHRHKPNLVPKEAMGSAELS